MPRYADIFRFRFVRSIDGRHTCTTTATIPQQQSSEKYLLHTMVFEDCPICLDEMHFSDNEHPLQCGRHCGFNFCRNCIQSFISSSKDDYMEASDGSFQVKVWLHCPSCRSDLTYSIRDTLLLRKVDELKHLLEEGRDDVGLTEAQIRLKDALERSNDVQNAVADSRRREADYFGLPVLEHMNEHDDDSDSCPSFEEWGVEADLLTGVHESFHCPRSPPRKGEQYSNITGDQIDTTLFGGLDFFISADCDRIDLTKLLISGDTGKLAEGAQILAEIAKSIREPQADSEQREPVGPHSRHRYFVKRSSVFELIAEAKEAHLDEEKVKHGILPSNNRKQQYQLRKLSASKVREVKLEVKKMAEQQKLYPLPVRMPKYVELEKSTKNQLAFVDDEWDGTVIDAYSKLTIGFNHIVSQRRAVHGGVRNILGDCEVRVELPHQPRVLLASVTQEMGKQGATKGDVLTHVQGHDVRGKTVADIRKLLSQMEPGETGKLCLVLNAERSVAEALKRRAVVMAEGMH